MGEIQVIQKSDNDGFVPALEPKYVVLGMMDEYLGRQAIDGGDVAERFFTNELSQAHLFTKYLFLCASALEVETDSISLSHAETGHSYVKSREMNEYINSWYNFEFPPDNTITLLDGRTHRIAYVGLTIDEFPQKKSMLYRPSEMNSRYSYIYGVFLRYGTEDLTIRIANASQKIALIKHVLEDLDVDWISHKYYLGGAPTCNEITFGADCKLKKLLDLALAERAESLEFRARG